MFYNPKIPVLPLRAIHKYTNTLEKTYETFKHSESMNIPGCSEDDGYAHRVQESLAT